MEATIDQKLRALYNLQLLDSKINKIRAIRGELPMEVSDLEDEIAGLETRLQNLTNELNELEDNIVNSKARIKESQQLTKKYEAQQGNVKNNREYDALTKEVEMKGLEIQATEKRIKEYQYEIEIKNKIIETSKTELEARKEDMEEKKRELDNIVEETQKEEDQIEKQRKEAARFIEERLLIAYDKIRHNVKNGIAVAAIVRDSCGGCFASVPPQRQSDIRQRKKIIVCEHCGRILVDAQMSDEAEGIVRPVVEAGGKGAEPETKAEATARVKAETAAKAKAETAAAKKAEPAAKTKAEPASKAKAKKEPEPEPEPKGKAKPKAKTKVGA
jgi:predicted  nucleic acid-binding Zn-ribbon protein